jgi:GNAT superfamily N-acetyltransferase
MNFWRNNIAAPSWLDTWNRHLFPSYKRFIPADKPTCKPYNEPRRAEVGDCEAIATFWNSFYCGNDWHMIISDINVKRYLEDSAVIAFVMEEAEYGIIGTILSIPCPLQLNNIHLTDSRIIEGLVVHPHLRKKGIAGILISYMDWYTSRYKPICHLWAREEPMLSTFFSTAVCRKKYSYTICERKQDFLPKLVGISEFQTIWNMNIDNVPFIKNTKIKCYRDDLKIWEIYGIYIVVTHTRRYTKDNRAIYEIVYCSNMDESKVSIILEHICNQYSGYMYTTLDSNLLSMRWKKGISGQHAYYLYNYVSPSYGDCIVNLVREEI